MEYILRCNALKCRKELNAHAVVTTCSHVFCIDCANRLRLSDLPNGQRPVCPACDTYLTNPDDAVITNLNPTEDYKTSVLSGLSPNLIMECAGRALSFWAYQTTQEVVYQEFLARSLTDKYTSLNGQMDKIVHEANAEIANLRIKMNNVLVDQDNLRRKNEELGQAFRDKSRKHSQIQELYDKLKRRAMLGHVQNAAFDAVDHTIQASAVKNQFMEQTPISDQSIRRLPISTDLQGNTMQPPRFNADAGLLPSIPPPIARAAMMEGRNSYSSHESNSQNEITQTPSSHRQRIANGVASSIGLANLQAGRTASAPLSQRRGTPSRQTLANLSPNGANTNGFAGFGMSAGVKVSHPSAAAQGITGGTRPMVKSRIAQRSGSSVFIDGRPYYGQAPGTNAFGHGNGYY